MWRSNRIILPLALVGLLLAGCGRFDSALGLSPSAELQPAIVVGVFGRGVFLVDAESGHFRLLRSGLQGFQEGYPAWSPDHSRIAFGDGGVVTLSPQTGRTAVVVRGQDDSMPAWSPDGSELAFGDGISLWVTETAPAGPHRVAVPAVIAPLEMTWSIADVIAFQGLALDCRLEVRCTSTGQSEIWSILPNGTGLIKLTSVGHAELPKWSPDGGRLLFIRKTGGSRRSEVWSEYSSGSGASRLVAATDVMAADWSPDGKHLVLIRPGTNPGTLQLWVAGPGGAHLKPLGAPFAGTSATLDW